MEDSLVALARRLCPGAVVETRNDGVVLERRGPNGFDGSVTIDAKTRRWELGQTPYPHPRAVVMFGQPTGRIDRDGIAPFEGRGWKERLILAAWTALAACMNGEPE